MNGRRYLQLWINLAPQGCRKERAAKRVGACAMASFRDLQALRSDLSESPRLSIDVRSVLSFCDPFFSAKIEIGVNCRRSLAPVSTRRPLHNQAWACNCP